MKLKKKIIKRQTVDWAKSGFPQSGKVQYTTYEIDGELLIMAKEIKKAK